MLHAVKLWHDDIRRQPFGWEWVRTNLAAQNVLRSGGVTEISMDHDLGLHEDNPDTPNAIYMMGPIQCGEGCGCDLIRWMIAEDLVPAKITVHSMNTVRALEMANILNDYGHDVTIEPYQSA